jgi:hypothetical protein
MREVGGVLRKARVSSENVITGGGLLNSLLKTTKQNISTIAAILVS